MWGPTHLSFK
jgi:hypothetical protein